MLTQPVGGHNRTAVLRLQTVGQKRLSGLTNAQRQRAVACFMFQSGVIHIGITECRDDELSTQAFYDTSIYKPTAMTQKFLNWAETNPDKWEDVANPSYWIMGTCKR